MFDNLRLLENEEILLETKTIGFSYQNKSKASKKVYFHNKI